MGATEIPRCAPKFAKRHGRLRSAVAEVLADQLATV